MLKICPPFVIFIACVIAAALGSAVSADFPQAEISNSQIRARVYLPDPQSGYYRGTRFDWSGAIASLEWNGHNYFGQWFERHDPKIHDGITGPVEEFLTNNAGLGYDEARAGDTFVRIGVGSIRKPEEPSYRRFSTYDIVDSGKWTVHKGRDWIEFHHQVRDASGYAYSYKKKLRLIKNKSELVLEHSLKNIGRKTITTSVYNHNFFMLDGQPTGPDSVVRFRFAPRATTNFNGLAEIRGNELIYLQELQRGQTAAADLQGFGSTSDDYDIRVENRKAGAAVRQTGNRPLSKLYFWSIRTTICPEPYVDLRIEPGRETTWRIAYEFYTPR